MTITRNATKPSHCRNAKPIPSLNFHKTATTGTINNSIQSIPSPKPTRMAEGNPSQRKKTLPKSHSKPIAFPYQVRGYNSRASKAKNKEKYKKPEIARSPGKKHISRPNYGCRYTDRNDKAKWHKSRPRNMEFTRHHNYPKSLLLVIHNKTENTNFLASVCWFLLTEARNLKLLPPRTA